MAPTLLLKSVWNSQCVRQGNGRSEFKFLFHYEVHLGSIIFCHPNLCQRINLGRNSLPF